MFRVVLKESTPDFLLTRLIVTIISVFSWLFVASVVIAAGLFAVFGIVALLHMYMWLTIGGVISCCIIATVYSYMWSTSGETYTSTNTNKIYKGEGL